MILHAQCAVNQRDEDFFGEIGIRADRLGLSSDAIEHDAFACGVAHDGTHGRLRGTDLARLGQAGADRGDDLGINDIEFCAQA